MHRRTFLALTAASLSGCVGTSDSSTTTPTHSGETTVDVLDWVDATTDAGISYSAVRVTAEGSPPSQAAFIAAFDDGSHERGTSPSDAEAYGDVGANLYLDPDEHDLAETPPGARSGWVVFHPDSDHAELASLEVSPLGSDHVLASWDRPKE